MQPITTSLVGGILPFGAVFTELFFIMSSTWNHEFYYLFGFLSLVLLIVLITCAEISIALTYCQLTSEDYRWWWTSFSASGSSGLYVFSYSIMYFNSRFQIRHWVSVLMYFGYMFIMSCIFGLINGAVGFYSTFAFVRGIYGSIKIESAQTTGCLAWLGCGIPQQDAAMPLVEAELQRQSLEAQMTSSNKHFHKKKKYIYIYTHLHAHIQVYIHFHLHRHLQVHIYIYVCTYKQVYTLLQHNTLIHSYLSESYRNTSILEFPWNIHQLEFLRCTPENQHEAWSMAKEDGHHFAQHQVLDPMDGFPVNFHIISDTNRG